MQLTATIDATAFTALQEELLKAIDEHSIPTVAESHKKRILGLTAQGTDAFGEIFHAYSPGHAKKRAAEGYSTDIKTLAMGEGRLQKIELVDDELTYTDDKAAEIAHGQMFHPKWRWHHHFFDVSDEEQAAESLAAVLNQVI